MNPAAPHPQAVVLAVGLNGLGALRSLRSAGIDAIAIVSASSDLPALSRLRIACHVVPDDGAWEGKVLALLHRIADGLRRPLIACSDRSAALLQNFREELEQDYALLIPGADVIDSLNDKRRELLIMQEAGIALPPFVATIDTHPSVALHCPLGLPVIIKPRTFADYALLGAKNLLLHTQADWRVFHQKYRTVLDRFVAQQVIEGDDTNLWVCNATVNREHQVVAAFCFRRLGTAPSHFGVTSLARSESNARVLAQVRELVRALRYIGPVMVEFKYQPSSDTYFYIETNPRLGMCNWFDTNCGVNNVATSCAIALGQTPQPMPAQKDGVVYVHALADLAARLEDREPLGSIMSRYWSVRGARVVWAVFVRGDLRPFLVSTWASLRALFYRTLRHIARKLGGRSGDPA